MNDGELLKSLLLASVPGILTGTATALLALHLALKRFKHEKWWERRAQAYGDILVALHHVRRYQLQVIDRIETGASQSDDYMRRLARRSAEGYDEIRKAAALGAFMVSAAAAARLEQLEKSLDAEHHNDDVHEAMCAKYDQVDAAIRDLRQLARKHLEV